MKDKIGVTFLLIYSLFVNAQQMESFLHKKLIVNVATMCEEVTGDQDCIGSQLYLMLYFDRNEVRISELEIDSCGKELVNKTNTYPWKLTATNAVEVNSLPVKLPLTDLEILSLELKSKQLIGSFKFLNGKIKQLVFNKTTTH